MQLESDNVGQILSRFVYDEDYIRSDRHPRKDVFMGPKSTRDVSVDRHAAGAGINWYAGAAVKNIPRVVASAELSAQEVKRPLHVRPYRVPRMPRHADITGWLDDPGWGANKELAKTLAQVAVCQMNPNNPLDEYVKPDVSFVVNCVGDLGDVLNKLKCLNALKRSDIECFCYVLSGRNDVGEAIGGLAIKDRRIVLIEVDLSDSKSAFERIVDGKSGVRGETVVFVGHGDSLESAIASNGQGLFCDSRSGVTEKIGHLRFSDEGDIVRPVSSCNREDTSKET